MLRARKPNPSPRSWDDEMCEATTSPEQVGFESDNSHSPLQTPRRGSRGPKMLGRFTALDLEAFCNSCWCYVVFIVVLIVVLAFVKWRYFPPAPVYPPSFVRVAAERSMPPIHAAMQAPPDQQQPPPPPSPPPPPPPAPPVHVRTESAIVIEGEAAISTTFYDALIADRERLDIFFTWAERHGMMVQTDKVRLRWWGKQRGFSLAAVQHLQEGETLFSIPESLVFHSASPYSQTHRVYQFYRNHELLLEGLGNLTMTAIALMVEKATPQSFWRPYLDILPELPMSPAYYEESELAEFHSNWIPSRRSGLTSGLEELFTKKWLPSLLENFPTQFGTTANPAFNAKDFLWAANLIIQRGFSHDFSWALVPYLDCINSELSWDEANKVYRDLNGYSFEEAALTNNDAAQGSTGEAWVERARKEYSPGQEVTGIYSVSGTTVLYLLQYGYITRNNMNDYVKLTLFLGSQERTVAGCYVMRDYRVPESFVKKVAVELRWKNRGGRPEGGEEAQGGEEEVTDDDIQQAKALIRDTIRNTPVMVGSSLRDDINRLHHINPADYQREEGEGGGDEGSITPGQYNAIAYRAEVKQFLNKVLETLDATEGGIWESPEKDEFFALENIVIGL